MVLVYYRPKLAMERGTKPDALGTRPYQESAKTWGGTEIPQGYSDHTMTGKQLSCLGIAGDRGVAHVHHRILDIGVPQPILHERDICAGVEQMHRNRVAQCMKA